eukprot:TRINITY_DN3483_c1_g1_i1.p1 TRINITY_DN3483_c1_g1~~TRINITY_DN3483_c1_g1_i1.p1  ORF type:complete len:1243 (+),score=432.95 TRINITY_DN3483_c1_g1_i1:355-4083(+)
MATPAWKDVMRQCGVDDMTLLSTLTNEAIAQNINERFQDSIIYTYIRDVLISVNPFRWIQGIYSEDIIQSYVGRSPIELPPHIYAVAEDSYRSMLMERDNQCCIISGESGAGKTECAKKIMEYIAAVSGGGGDSQIEHIKKMILETNPLLEAFGNAKTLRNNNSSRFGKYFEIQFTATGAPMGGVITSYLLEKSRIVDQLDGERNFHVFYQFCKGANETERSSFGVYGPESFAMLMCGNTTDVQGIDDIAEYNDMRNAMEVLGLAKDEQDSIFRILAAVMWLGNIEFKEDAREHAKVTDQSVLDFAAGLLGVPPSMLKTALEIREVETKHGLQRGTTYKVPLNNVQAYASKDALAKNVYSALFNWIVDRVNRSLEVTPGPDWMTIGVLDIYGFEVFDRNGFEQLCINYVNEKLQQIFIEFTLRLEQEEYVREGINWTPIDYFNNKIVCDLIEGRRPPGIFLVMDDVAKAVHSQGEGADRALCQRLPTAGGGNNPHFQMRGDHFLIKHYAGDVYYEANGMVERTKDKLSNDMLEVVQMSELAFLNALFPVLPDQANTKKMSTAGGMICKQADLLVKTLTKAMPHYVRCMKPNDNKDPAEFDAPRVMHQIRYLGLLDNVKVRRAGFAYRTEFKKFMDRYFLLSSRTSYAAKLTWNGDARSGSIAVLEDQPFAREEWQIGKTKIFIRHPETLFCLEDNRVNYYHNMSNRIKNAFVTWRHFKDECSTRIKRAYMAWRNYRNECVAVIQNAFRDFKEGAPYHVLKMNNEQNFRGKKERRRYSTTSIRKFFGDYLDMKKQQQLLNAMGPGAHEKVLFSSKAQVVVHPGMFRANKLSPRFLIVTDNSLYLIMLVKTKQGMEHRLDRRIPLADISQVTLSPYGDNYVVVQCPNSQAEWDVVIECDFKTELVGWLSAKGSLSNNVQFADVIQYEMKKKKKNKIKFLKDDQFPEGMYKKDKVKVGSHQAASTQVAVLERKTGRLLGTNQEILPPSAAPVVKKASRGLRQMGGSKWSAPPTASGGSVSAAAPAPAKAKAAPAAAAPSPSRGGGGGPPPRGGGGPPRGRGGAPPRGGGAPPRGGGAPPRGGGAPRGGGGGGASPRGGAPPRGGGGAPRGRGGGGAPRGAGGPPRGRGGAPPRGGGGAPRGRGAGPPRGGGGGPPRGRGAAPRGAGGPPRGRGGASRGRGGGPGASAAPKGPQCKALYFYDAVQDDELTFKEGDLIDIVKKDGDWWLGRFNGNEGLFPANFVEEV